MRLAGVSRPRLPNRRGRAVVTLLATDVVGSTQKVSQLGDAQWRRVLDRHDLLIRRHTQQFRGHDLGSAGDGFLLAFDVPIAAVGCAAAIRTSLTGIGLQVRAGIHTGECELRGDQLAGLSLHVAARIGALAEPGQILASATVKDLLGGSPTELEPLGSRELRDVPGEWSLYEVKSINVAMARAAALRHSRLAERSKKRRLAMRWTVAASCLVITLAVARNLVPDRTTEIAVAALDSRSGTLALAVQEGPMLELRLQEAGGSQQIESVGRFPFLGSLMWSDDGCHLAFAAGSASDRSHVYVVAASDGLARLTRSAAEYRIIDWAPNSKRILVSTGAVIGGGLRSIDIVTGEIRASSVAQFESITLTRPPSGPRCSVEL